MSRYIKTERIELRTIPEIKVKIERAARLMHKTLTEYLLDSAIQKANNDLKENESIALNNNDRDLFFSLLINPPKPNKALRGLFKPEHKE